MKQKRFENTNLPALINRNVSEPGFKPFTNARKLNLPPNQFVKAKYGLKKKVDNKSPTSVFVFDGQINDPKNKGINQARVNAI